MIHLNQASQADPVTVPVGETLEVELPENPTTGFRWQLVANGAPVCRTVGDQREHTPSVPGRPGTRRWTFQAAQPGDADIDLVYGRPWEQRETRRFHVRVHVTP